jgi:hypothetical protein
MLDCWIDIGNCLPFCWRYIGNLPEPAQLHLIGEPRPYDCDANKALRVTALATHRKVTIKLYGQMTTVVHSCILVGQCEPGANFVMFIRYK